MTFAVHERRADKFSMVAQTLRKPEHHERGVRQVIARASVAALVVLGCGEPAAAPVASGTSGGGGANALGLAGSDHVYPTGHPLHAAERVWTFFAGHSLLP